MPIRVLNIEDVQFSDLAEMSRQLGEELPQERFGGRRGMVGRKMGAQKLGYNVTVLAPGKRAFPFHNHRVNEEMFFVLEGEGELRAGAETLRVRKGDFVACPPGGMDMAHQFVNTGSAELKYLAVSTLQSPDICEYPDSGKFAVRGPDDFQHIGLAADKVKYWHGE